ncbi:MAG: hypothetical protein M1827_002145 [Pycnora praestabilis]|nr:MAG: hypothetical protein M1827_002145 [Pycnora praestabilis]
MDGDSKNYNGQSVEHPQNGPVLVSDSSDHDTHQADVESEGQETGPQNSLADSSDSEHDHKNQFKGLFNSSGCRKEAGDDTGTNNGSDDSEGDRTFRLATSMMALESDIEGDGHDDSMDVADDSGIHGSQSQVPDITVHAFDDGGHQDIQMDGTNEANIMIGHNNHAHLRTMDYGSGSGSYSFMSIPVPSLSSSVTTLNGPPPLPNDDDSSSDNSHSSEEHSSDEELQNADPSSQDEAGILQRLIAESFAAIAAIKHFTNGVSKSGRSMWKDKENDLSVRVGQ